MTDERINQTGCRDHDEPCYGQVIQALLMHIVRGLERRPFAGERGTQYLRVGITPRVMSRGHGDLT